MARIAAAMGLAGKRTGVFRSSRSGKQGGDAWKVDPAVHLSFVIWIPSPSELVQPG